MLATQLTSLHLKPAPTAEPALRALEAARAVAAHMIAELADVTLRLIEALVVEPAAAAASTSMSLLASWDCTASMTGNVSCPEPFEVCRQGGGGYGVECQGRVGSACKVWFGAAFCSRSCGCPT